jgi:hypothetical protein
VGPNQSITVGPNQAIIPNAHDGTVGRDVDDAVVAKLLLAHRRARGECEVRSIVRNVVLDLHASTRVIHALKIVSSIRSTTSGVRLWRMRFRV